MRLLAALFLLFCSPALAADPIIGVVTNVHDGDTFTLGSQRIRLWGIDAPELKQEFGAHAQKTLQTLIYSQLITCTPRGKSYDRIVANCTIGQMDIATFMIQAGMAFEATQYSKGAFTHDEQKARMDGTGIWSLASIENPAAWRARH